MAVDGCRESDGKFHLNFGWGGYKDNWYQLPDPGGFSYGWTKIEGIILDIIPMTAPLAVHKVSRPQQLELYPNPVSEAIYLKGNSGEVVDYTIYNVVGQQVASGSTCGRDHHCYKIEKRPVPIANQR